jgi:hypothetical protein
MRLPTILLTLVLIVLGTTAAQATPKPKQSAPAQATESVRRAAVEVLWGGSWWPAEVLERRGKLTKIHYTGWGSEWDEWVQPARLRPAAARKLSDAAIGQKLEVEWHGSWWPAEVIEKRSGFFKIHYTGWGSEWDEWIEPSRMRAAAVVKR